MCMPVMPKNTAPKSGEPSGLLVMVKCSLKIMFIHSVKCRPVKIKPPSMVATIHMTVFLRSLRCAAITAITIVSELASSTIVIVVENAKRARPVGIGEPRIAVDDQQGRKRQRVRDDEQPHP